MQRVIIISDLHIGGASAPMLGAPGLLCSFLDEISDHKPVEDETIELIINGDFVDFLALEKCEAWTPNEDAAIQKLETCFNQFPKVFDAFARAANRVDRFTVLLGNHDIELAYPRVRRRLLERLNTSEHRCLFIIDNEAYRRGELHVEHGNRFDAWNAIDYDGLRHVVSSHSRGEDPPAMEICPGSRLVQDMVWPLKETYPFIDLLKPETKVLPLLLVAFEPAKLVAFQKLMNVAEGWWSQLLRMQDWLYEFRPRSEKFISSPSFRTGLPKKLASMFPDELRMLEKSLWIGANTTGKGFDGLAATLIRDRKPPDRQLEKIQEALRCVLDGDQTFERASSDGPYLEAAKKICSTNKNGWAAPKVVVMGHTHAPRNIAGGGEWPGVYLNTGSWVDSIKPPQSCLEDSIDGRKELLDWLRKIVTDSSVLRKRDPQFADLTLDDSGKLTQPVGRPMLREYLNGPVF
jgi:UDP-2,3-diacylglucosamine pyrophosphatase LpxH